VTVRVLQRDREAVVLADVGDELRVVGMQLRGPDEGRRGEAGQEQGNPDA
jgi:hypothetical protein